MNALAIPDDRPLSDADREELAELEQIIDSASIEATMALARIKERRLYRPKTWADYCWDRFKYKARTVDYQIEDAKLKSGKSFSTSKASHSREVAKFPPELQGLACDAVNTFKPTAARFKELREKITNKPPSEAARIVEESKAETMRRAKDRRQAIEQDKDAKALASVRRKAAACLLMAESFTEAALGRLEGLVDTDALRVGWQMVKAGAMKVVDAVEAESSD